MTLAIGNFVAGRTTKKGGGAFAPPPFIPEESVLLAGLRYGYGSVEPASISVWRPSGNAVGTQLWP